MLALNRVARLRPAVAVDALALAAVAVRAVAQVRAAQVAVSVAAAATVVRPSQAAGATSRRQALARVTHVTAVRAMVIAAPAPALRVTAAVDSAAVRVTAAMQHVETMARVLRVVAANK